MDIKRLNEELEKFLAINEISDELVDKVSKQRQQAVSEIPQGSWEGESADTRRTYVNTLSKEYKNRELTQQRNYRKEYGVDRKSALDTISALKYNSKGLSKQHEYVLYEIESWLKDKEDVNDLDSKLYFLQTHNKGYNKKQEMLIDELISSLKKGDNSENLKRIVKEDWSDKELQQVGAINSTNAKYKLYQDKGGELFITTHKLNRHWALMDENDSFEVLLDNTLEDFEDCFLGFDLDLLNDTEAVACYPLDSVDNEDEDELKSANIYDLSKAYDD